MLINKEAFMFIGREKELNYLEEAYRKDTAQLIAIYGRRRIGKTELLKEFVKDKENIFYYASELTEDKHLESLSSMVYQYESNNHEINATYSNWDQLFDAIYKISLKKKIILVIDEYPNLVI